MCVALPDPTLLDLVAQIVSAHFEHNAVAVEALPDLIQSVHGALKRAGADPAPVASPLQPAVPIRRSVFAGHIVCLEDGKEMTMLKRHLLVSHGLSPEQYRQRWGLPRSYPMSAPDYAASRSAAAKARGLGRRSATTEEPETPPIRRIPAGLSGKRAARRAKAVED